MKPNISLYFFIFLLVCGCGTDSQPSEHEVSVVKATELGVIGSPASVSVRDGGASVSMGDSILWTFGDTIFSPISEDSSNGRSNTAALAPLTDPLKTSEPTDGKGAPYQAIPFTSKERNFNDSHPDARIALWPGGLVSQDDGSAIAFVSKLRVNSGNMNYKNMGVITAQFSPGQTTASRTGNLFKADEPLFVSSFKYDGYVYLYGLITVDGSKGIGVARASTDQATERSAYNVWDGSAWSPDLQSAKTLFKQVPGAVNVAFNNYLGKFTAVYSLALSNKVLIRTAKHPEGPWSKPVALFTGKIPEEKNKVDYAGRDHPELAKDDGIKIYVSYFNPTKGFLKGELRLVEVEFE